jgi:hypothetical protein
VAIKRMKKYSLIGTAFILFFTVTSAISQETPKIRLKVITQNANIRIEPNLTAKIIAQVPSGTILDSPSKQGQWFKVAIPLQYKSDKEFGFVFETIVDVLPAERKPADEGTRVVSKPENKITAQSPATSKGTYDEVAWVINKKYRQLESSEELRNADTDISWSINKKSPDLRKSSDSAVESKPSTTPLKISVGVQAGLAIASLSSEKLNDSKLSFQIGGFAQLQISPSLGLRCGMNYANKGAIFIGNGYNDKWTIRYLEVPFLANYRLLSNNRFIVSALAGPFVAIRLSGINTRIDKTTSESIEEEPLFGIQALDYGLILGAELQYAITGSLSLFLGLNYELGLANIINLDSFFSIQSGRTRSLTFNIGIVI